MSKRTTTNGTRTHLTIDRRSGFVPGAFAAITVVAFIVAITARAGLIHDAYTYDWSTATVGSNLAGNDSWVVTDTPGGGSWAAISDTSQPAGFSGNYVDFYGNAYGSSYYRTNDANFSYSIDPSVKHLSLSIVFESVDTTYIDHWIGLRDSNNGQTWTIGRDPGDWLYRDRSGTEFLLGNGSGDGQFISSVRPYKVTVELDLENQTLNFLVDNLTTPGIGPEVLAANAPLGNFGDASAFDGLFIGGRKIRKIDDITLLVPEPASLALVAIGGLALFARRRPKK